MTPGVLPDIFSQIPDLPRWSRRAGLLLSRRGFLVDAARRLPRRLRPRGPADRAGDLRPHARKLDAIAAREVTGPATIVLQEVMLPSARWLLQEWGGVPATITRCRRAGTRMAHAAVADLAHQPRASSRPRHLPNALRDDCWTSEPIAGVGRDGRRAASRSPLRGRRPRPKDGFRCGSRPSAARGKGAARSRRWGSSSIGCCGLRARPAGPRHEPGGRAAGVAPWLRVRRSALAAHARMIKTELHSHTDGDRADRIAHSAETLIDRASAQGYGALAITLHERWTDPAPLRDYAAGRGLVILSGTERSSERKHVLIINGPKDAERLKRRSPICGPTARRTPRRSSSRPRVLPDSERAGAILDQHPDLFDARSERDARERRRLQQASDGVGIRARQAAGRQLGPAHPRAARDHVFDGGRVEPTPDAICDAIKRGRVEVVSTHRTGSVRDGSSRGWCSTDGEGGR